MNCDLLIQHSIYITYPIWQSNLYKHRDRFNKVIIYPSDHNRETHNYKPFLEGQLKETWVKDHVIDWTAPGIDWRQAETEPMLPLSTSEWIYFNEPDFYVRDYEKFYDKVQKAMDEGADAVGLWNPTHYPYLHPSSFFVKREALDKTHKDFRAHPEINGCDHFAMITKDLQTQGAKIVTYQELGLNCEVVPEADCFHLGGLTGNYIDASPEHNFHRPEPFFVQNWWSRNMQIPTSKDYLDLSNRVEQIVKKKYDIKIDPVTSRWSRMFK